MLYTLSTSPYYVDLFTLTNILTLEDDLLLLSDGVIAGLSNSKACYMLQRTKSLIYALNNDVVSRGLLTYFSESIRIIDYHYFMKLTEIHVKQISWK